MSYHQAYGFKNPSLPRVRNTRQKSTLQRLIITHKSFQLLHCKSCQFNVFPTQLSVDLSPTITWNSYLQLSSASEHFPTAQNGSELKWPNKNRVLKSMDKNPWPTEADHRRRRNKSGPLGQPLTTRGAKESSGQDQDPGSLPSLNIAPQPVELGKVAENKHLARSGISVTSCYSHPAVQMLPKMLGSRTVSPP